MALLDTPQAMYGGMTSPYLIQNHPGYNRSLQSGYYEPETIARLNIQHSRLVSSPEQQCRDLEFARFVTPVKEERLGGHTHAFKPYSPDPGQENVPAQANQQHKLQVFSSKADLQLHTQVHMREPKPYKCSQCSKSFANSSYLSQHMRIHLGIKPYRCEICQRKFTQLSHLQQHIRTHTGDKPYKCRHPGCTKAFSQLSNLQSHSRCHQTDKPYKCNSCYKCFHDEQSLLEHIPKHKESKHLKTHICSYCGKSYTQETYLAKHMQKHSDRADKRPPIVAAGTSNPVGQLGALGSLGAHTDPYWPKMDPSGYASYGHQLMEQRLPDPRDYDPRGLHPGAGNHQSLMGEDLRHHAGHAVSWSEHTSGHNSVVKTTSAFSPIQSGMLPTSGYGMAASSRGFPFYDPISFPQATPKVNFGEPSSTSSNSFPGPQLLSLSKIKNYAHNPHNDGLFKSLQEKAASQLGQLGTAQ